MDFHCRVIFTRVTPHTLPLFYLRAYARKNYATVEIHLELVCVVVGIISTGEVLEEAVKPFGECGAYVLKAFRAMAASSAKVPDAQNNSASYA